MGFVLVWFEGPPLERVCVYLFWCANNLLDMSGKSVSCASQDNGFVVVQTI